MSLSLSFLSWNLSPDQTRKRKRTRYMNAKQVKTTHHKGVLLPPHRTHRYHYRYRYRYRYRYCYRYRNLQPSSLPPPPSLHLLSLQPSSLQQLQHSPFQPLSLKPPLPRRTTSKPSHSFQTLPRRQGHEGYNCCCCRLLFLFLFHVRRCHFRCCRGYRGSFSTREPSLRSSREGWHGQQIEGQRVKGR